MRSAGSDQGYSESIEEHNQEHAYHTQQQQQQQQQGHFSQHPNQQKAQSFGPSSSYSAPNALNSLNGPGQGSNSSSGGLHQPHASQGVPSAAPTLTYRVRGGPQHSNNSSALGPTSAVGSSTNSLHSSGGWIVQGEEDAAAAEEALKLELKKAKVLYLFLLSYFMPRLML